MIFKSRFIEMFGDLKENQNYRTILFSQCTKSMIKGPFGSDMKKSLYVPKGKDTYKVYIQLNAIQRNQSLGNYYISKDYFDKKISRFEVKPNDFIITCDGTLGKLLQLDENMEKGVISSSLLKITLDETVIDSSFFEILWTNVILPNLSRYTRNACLVHLPSVSTIGNLEFHLPDLYLQKEYTKLVKQIDKSKFLLQKILEKLELLKKSRFIEMFGRLGCDDKKWGLVSLGEFCLLNPQKSELHNISDDTEVSFLPMSSVSENGELTLSERKLYRDVKSGFSYFAEGDVLFAKITPCMENGKGAVAHGLCNNIGFGSTEFHVLRAKTSVCNPYWLYELLSLKQFRKIAEQNMTGSAGQKRVPAKFLQNFKLSLPPIELQNEYVSISRQIDKSKLVIQKSLEDLVGKS